MLELMKSWNNDSRWNGITRTYSPNDVIRLSGSVREEHTLASLGAKRLWHLLSERRYVKALGALSGNQAIQQVEAGLEAVYVSGLQVAADANDSGQMYPDQSLYPSGSVPNLVRKINNALRRADQIRSLEGRNGIYWFAPIIADAEAGFGGTLNTFEIMQAMIDAGAAAVHFEDQLAALKKCGRTGGKILIPTNEFVKKLSAARLAADIMDVPTVLIARTHAKGAQLLQSDIDPLDQMFMTGTRTVEGFYGVRGGIGLAIIRALAFAPFADMIWCETSSPDLGEAQEFAQAIHEKFPGKFLAYNCSPSFNWKKNLDHAAIARFHDELADIGYKFQFVALAGFHSLNFSMFDLAASYRKDGMVAYSRLQEREFELERQEGYKAVKHQSFVGSEYYDEIQLVLSQGRISTTALQGSAEQEQSVSR